MSVEKDVSRVAVNIKWDVSKTGGNCSARCENPETGDVSTTDDLGDDGFGVVTFPEGYSGTCKITVTGDDGEDEGTIEV